MDLAAKVNPMVFVGLPNKEQALIKFGVKVKAYTSEFILATVCIACDVTIQAVCGSRRQRELVEARVIYVYLLRNILKFNYSHIGRLLKKDHSSIIYYINVFDELIDYNKEFQEKYNRVKSLL